MPPDIPIYFINLDRRTDRRQFMEKQFLTLGLEAARISGPTPNQLSEAEKQRYCDSRRPNALSEPQLCCAKGHFAAWKRLVESSAERAVIFEDDIVLSSRITEFLGSLPPLEADIIRLENTDHPQLNSHFLEPVIANTGLREMRSNTWSSAGYLLTRQAAEMLVNSPHVFKHPVDWTLFCKLEKPASRMRLLQADPALCIQSRVLDEDETTGINKTDNAMAPRSGSVRAALARRFRRQRWRLLEWLEPVLHRGFDRRTISFSAD